MIATILPPHHFFGHSINASINDLSGSELLYIVALLNSFVVDYAIRQRVSANLTMFYIYQLPIPRLTPRSPIFRLIVQRAARLICTTSDFASLWSEVFPDESWSPMVIVDVIERAQLRAEIDGLVAHLYGISEEEFSYMISIFPLALQGMKEAVLQKYREFAMTEQESNVLKAIEGGESHVLEFKVAACWDAVRGRRNEEMRVKVLEEVAAFLNSRDGGTVLIGVADDGTIVGLEDDYRTANPQKRNRDGYALYLLEHLQNFLQGNWSLCYQLSFQILRGREICRIDIQPASEPVYTTQGNFLIREDRRKRSLTPQETMAYIRQRWP